MQKLSDALDAIIEKGSDGLSDDEPKPVLYRDLTGGDAEPVWQIVNIWEASEPFARLMRRAVAIHYMTSEAVFTGRDHPMRQFISIGAGPHFPTVCRDGKPVEMSAAESW